MYMIRVHLGPPDVDPLAGVRIPRHWKPAFCTPAGLAVFGRTVDFLEASPSLHRQEQWITEHVGLGRTRACFAGWTALLAGAVPIKGWRGPAGRLPGNV